nr:acetyltransferase [Stenotrophomonas maltophilia]
MRISTAVPPSNEHALDDRPVALFGAGGHARETLLLLRQCGLPLSSVAGFFVDPEYCSNELMDGLPLLPISAFDPARHQAIIAVGNSLIRRDIADRLPAGTHFPSVVHPSAVMADDQILQPGLVVHAGSVITCNVTFGRHVMLNRSTHVGHDSVLGAFVTTAPGAIISGNCVIGEASYLGAMSCIREKQRIGAEATVGMGAIVVSDVPAQATYVGNPARPLQRRSA